MEAAYLTGDFFSFPPVLIEGKVGILGNAQQLYTHVHI
jgi:hypothetical protein